MMNFGNNLIDQLIGLLNIWWLQDYFKDLGSEQNPGL